VLVSRKKKGQKDAAATANDAIVSTHKYHDRADSEGTLFYLLCSFTCTPQCLETDLCLWAVFCLIAFVYGV